MGNSEFIKELENLNIYMNSSQASQLEKYYTLLIEWNQKMNLTRIIEKEDIYLKHFYDSATLSKIINLKDYKSLCDIGTGAGFPGMILKILFPHLQVTLIDSLHKRIHFLKEVIHELSLDGITVIEERAEEYAKIHREKFDIVTSRAVAPLSILMEYSVPLLKVDGYFIPMKGKIEDEMKNIGKATIQLGIELEEKQIFTLPIENSQRSLIKFKKKKITNIKYPRKYNEIKKHPL